MVNMIQPSKIQKYSLIAAKKRSELPYIDMLKKSFDDVQSQSIIKNYNINNSLKIIIKNSNMNNNTNGEYGFVSYPYDTPQFAIGDFLSINKYGVERIFIINALDVLYPFDVKGTMQLCNKNIKWIDNDTNKNADVVFLDSISSIGIKNEGSKNIPLATASAILYTQDNEDNKFIKINKRFFIDENVYKVVSVINIKDKLLRIDIEKDIIRDEDDTINHIAYNETEETIINTTSDDTYSYNITPTDYQIQEGNHQSFTIQKYNNEIIKDGNYTFATTGVPKEYFNLEINSNTFTIYCYKHYEKQPLVINIIDTTTSQEIIKTVRLVERGGF